MKPIRKTYPQQGKVTWADLINHPPSYEEVELAISKWAAKIAAPTAQLPRRSDPGYDTRMLEAYVSTCDNIAATAENSEDIDAGMRIVYMEEQATPYAGLIQVDGNDLNLARGPRHIQAGWPAIVAGRYQQLREIELGNSPLNELADLNSWINDGKYEPSYAETEAEWGETYEGEPQVLSNPVSTESFDADTWRTLQKAITSLAKDLTSHPSFKLSTNFRTLERQLEAYEREIPEFGWPAQGKESCYVLWELLSEEHQAALRYTPSIQALRHENFQGDIGHSATGDYRV